MLFLFAEYDSQSKMFWNQLLVDYLPRKHMISQSENTVEMIPIWRKKDKNLAKFCICISTIQYRDNFFLKSVPIMLWSAAVHKTCFGQKILYNLINFGCLGCHLVHSAQQQSWKFYFGGIKVSANPKHILIIHTLYVFQYINISPYNDKKKL